MNHIPPRAVGVDDVARLAALAAFGILDTPPERGFDDIVHLARRLCDAPVALVSLVDRDRQWFKARVGFPPCETDLDRSVCKFALAEPGILQIPDLTADPRTMGNPLVTGEPHLRFYAGAPLRTPEGLTLGSLCVIDRAPRPQGLTPAQAEDLEALARQVMDQLTMRRALAERDDALADQRRFLAQRATLIETQGAVAAAEGDLDAVLATLAAGALRAVAAAEGVVVELREGEDLVYRSVAGTLAGRAGTSVPVGASLAGACLRSGEAILCPDAALDPRVDASAAEDLGMRSCIVLPVTRGPETVGVLKLQSGLPNAFNERDLYAALTFAGSASAGLAQAGEAEARRVALESERLLGLERGLLRAVLQQAPVGISIAHADGGALLNDRLVAMLGHGVGGADDDRYAGYGALHADGRPYAVMDYPTIRALRRGETIDGEAMRYRHGTTGEVREWRAHSAPVHGPGGEIIAAVSVFIDVEDRRRDAMAAARLAAIAEQSGDFIGIADVDGRVEYVNPAGRTMVGFPDQAAARAARVRDFFFPDDLPYVEAEIVPRVVAGDAWVGDFAFRNFATGEPVPVHYNQFSLRGPDGEFAGYATVSRDIAERKRAEARQAALLALGDRLRDPGGVADVTRAAAEVVGRVLDVRRAGYGSVDAAVEHVAVESDWNAPGWASIVGRHRFADYGDIREDHRAGRALVVDDALADPRTAADAEALRGIGVRALVNMPVRERGRPVALFFVHDDRPRAWSEGELTFLRNVAERVEAGVAAVRARERQDLLNHELSHRMKNMVALVQAIASSTLRGASDMDAARDVLGGRLVALGRAHDVLLGGTAERAPLATVVREAVGVQESEGRVAYAGPEVEIGGRAALALTLMLHELTTNAVKYGALSVPEGRVAVEAALVDAGNGPGLRLAWVETGGPPVTPPARRGFGSRLIERGLTAQVGGSLRVEFAREGLRCVVEAPLANFQAAG